MEADKNMVRVATEEASRFIVDCLHAAGANREAAELQAKLLIEAEKFSHPSHGLNRLEFYINDIISGACEPNNKPEILKETASTAWVDANNVLGATSSHFAMDIAIAKARQTGIAWVVVKGANHFGMAGYWAQKATDQGLIGMAFSNTSPVCAPTRSKQAALGTNPLACSAPASSGESFYLDMATTAVALGKIEMQIRKRENIPAGWAQGPDGNETRDAQVAFDTRCVYPLGGSEVTSGYKGYGLGAMVELFCGILGGSKYGHHIRAWSHESDGTPADLGHCFVAIDPHCFAPGFGDRLTELIQYWRKLEPETASTAWVDANNVLGATSSHFAMDIAIAKARQTGIAWVVVKGANHFGMAGYWAQKATDQGLIGMAFSNTSPVCAPTRSKQAALGTNPLACSAPASSGESFYLDMATTAVALGKIEMQIRKRENIPAGWAQGPDGNETRDAQVAFDTRCVYPLGGSEVTSGYKGYGLGAMVELFCGILGGSKYGHHIRAWSHESDGTPADLGHCFVAIDPHCFAPGFGDRLTELIQYWRKLEPLDPNLPVLAPGDKEKLAAVKAEEAGTVSFVQQQIDSSLTLAMKLKVKPMECLIK